MTPSTVHVIALGLMALGGFYAVVRLFKGPTTPDRIVAADTLAVIAVAGLAAYAALSGNPVYLDIALVYATLAFVGTVAIARSLEAPGQ